MKRFVPSPSMGVSLLALVVALGGVGVAANGGNFVLGQSNSATATTRLISPVNGGDGLEVRNLSTAAGATALRLQTANGKPPMEVTSTSRVAKLNADMVDGKHAADFASAASEGWHHIGDDGEPAFENGWRNYDPEITHDRADWKHASYRIDQNGTVHLAGLIKAGGVGTTAFTLARKYCPWHNRLFATLSNNILGRITVNGVNGTAGGCEVIVQFGSTVWISLDGLSYQNYRLDLVPFDASPD